MYQKTWAPLMGSCLTRPRAREWRVTSRTSDVRMVDLLTLGLSAVLAPHLLSPFRALQPRDLADAACGAGPRRRHSGHAENKGGMAGADHDGRPRTCMAVGCLGLFLERYETINWAASYFAAGFAVEAALLVFVGGFRQVSFRLSQDASRAGLAISAFAMFLYPLIAPALGRPWTQSETFGVTPDPTAIAALGILLVERGRFRWGLSVVPLIWCALSTATLWAMDSFDALVPVLAGCLVLLIAMRKWEPKPDRKEALEHHLGPRAASAGGASPSAERKPQMLAVLVRRGRTSGRRHSRTGSTLVIR